LWLSPNNEQKFWGAVSLLGLTAFILSAFTFDSFVIPNMWVVFGLITAAYTVYKFPKVYGEEVKMGSTSQADNLGFYNLNPADGSVVNE